jgi:hypothetical protein
VNNTLLLSLERSGKLFSWKGLERVVPDFNNSIVLETNDDMEVHGISKHEHVLTRESCFSFLYQLNLV